MTKEVTQIVRFNGEQFITALPGFGHMTYTTIEEMKAFLNRQKIEKFVIILNKNAKL